MIQIRTSGTQYIEVEAWTNEEKAPGVKRTRFNRFFVIMPGSVFAFTHSGNGTGGYFELMDKKGTDRMAFDKTYNDGEDLDDFMTYIASTIDYDKTKKSVDDLIKNYEAALAGWKKSTLNPCPLSSFLKDMVTFEVDCKCNGILSST